MPLHQRVLVVIDPDGFRPNVGIIVLHPVEPGRVLLAKRIGQAAWQFPQGGVQRGEAIEQACFRELEEELGLRPQHVELLGVTREWHSYLLPRHLVRRGRRPVCIGQKQRWFLLRLRADESNIQLQASRHPEFDDWRWTDYWQPWREVISFKREVYHKALSELAPLAGAPTAP